MDTTWNFECLATKALVIVQKPPRRGNEIRAEREAHIGLLKLRRAARGVKAVSGRRRTAARRTPTGCSIEKMQFFKISNYTSPLALPVGADCNDTLCMDGQCVYETNAWDHIFGIDSEPP